ncbi:MAG: hypothetical protein JZU52_08175 [Lamprocystis purpurea]|jgi:hypothetical protein|uniref:hypothetical protein n=1 Tax=Lamprocystis purpurea TaxID=61598 RepID=UPI00035CA125|nr:hypothetical protein [Lamprocystis purpurea]MBV5273607.1 hypothetical protein [Lamprocystis purpurea]
MAISRQQLSEEIASIPDDKIAEVFSIVHRYRVDLESTPADGSAQANDFAGIWADMPDEAFQDFLRDVEDRRHNAFSSGPAR